MVITVILGRGRGGCRRVFALALLHRWEEPDKPKENNEKDS